MTILFPHYLVCQQLGLVSAIWISWIILLLFLLLVVHAASHLGVAYGWMVSHSLIHISSS